MLSPQIALTGSTNDLIENKARVVRYYVPPFMYYNVSLFHVVSIAAWPAGC
jgi:hypothetical protein